jgi:Protein of unknown function (DUF3574)
MRAMMRGVAVAVAFAMLSACRTLPPPTVSTAGVFGASLACASGEYAMRRDTLYFGRNRPDGGAVSDAQWQAFVDDAIVSRFPDGFTVLDAEGHWRSGNGAIEREASKVVIVLHAGESAALQAIDAIVADYKRQFVQEAVLRERMPTCAKF